MNDDIKEMIQFLLTAVIFVGTVLFVMSPSFWSMIRSGANFFFG